MPAHGPARKEMTMRNSDQSYYLRTALQALESAYAHNRDASVGPHLSRAIDALNTLAHHQTASSVGEYSGTVNDPYEVNDFNSAI